jgi:hypothetical protein
MQNIIVLCRHCESPISFSFFRFRFGHPLLLLSRRRTSIAIQAAPTVCSWAGRLLPAGHSRKPHHTPPAGFHLLLRPDFKYTHCTPHPHCVSLLSRPDAQVAWSKLPHTPHLSAAAITPCFHIHSGGDTTLTPYSIYYAINELRRLWRG